MKRFLRFALLIAAVSAVIGCNSTSKVSVPDTAFASYVKAFSGGVVAEGRPIQIILQGEVNPTEEELFSFSPAIKGHQNFPGGGIVEFVPDEGSIEAGKKYDCTFKLGKVVPVGDSKLEKFSFSFSTAVKMASLNIEEVKISAKTPEIATITGTVKLSSGLEAAVEVETPGAVENSFAIAKNAEGGIYTFKASYNRNNEDKTVTINLKKAEGYKIANASETAVIPGKAEFKLIGSQFADEAIPYVKLCFSQPVAKVAEGLISIEDCYRYYTMQEDNIVKVFFENSYSNVLNVNVDAAVSAANGTRLGQSQRLSFTKTGLKPAVEIVADGNIVPDADNVLLPFKAVNLKAVDVKVIKIFENNVLGFLQENSLAGSSELRRSGRLIYSNTVRLDTDPEVDLHKWQNFSIDLSGLFKQEQGAIYRIRLTFRKEYSVYGKENNEETALASFPKSMEEEVEVWDIPYSYYYDSIDWDEYNWEDVDNPDKPTYYMQESRFPAINLMTSNIGLIVKEASGDRIWVAATDLASSDPMSGVEITAYNYQLQKVASGKTNGSGLVELKVEGGKPFAVTGHKGNSTSYLRVKSGEQNSLSRFDVGGSFVENGLKGFVYGERGVWRPGDTLHLTVLIQDKGENLPQGHPVIMELYSPEGQFYAKQINANGIDGFYRFDQPTSDSDPTGIWNAYFKAGGSSFHKSVRIETIKPNRLKINANFAETVLQSGARATLSISSNWLTGPAASGLKAKAVMTLGSAGTHFKGFEGYTFNDPLKAFSSEEVQLLDTRLDQSGKAAAAITMPQAYNAPGMLSAYILYTVEENGGDESLTSAVMPFSPYSAYVGIKEPSTKDYYLETDKDQVFQVAVVDKDGDRVKGHNLEYKIYKLKWSWWWEDRASELDSYVNSPSANVIASGRMLSGKNDNTITLRVNYPEWGRYLVYVKDLDSGHASGKTVFVDWPSTMGRSSKSDPDALTMLSFSTDKKEYKVGEQATVYIPSNGGKAHALVSLENASGVISSEWVTISGKEDKAYKFKITDQMAPNFYIHITLVQPNGNVSNDLPIRLYGVVPISVVNPASHLEPVISMADSIHPEEEFGIDISEKNGKTMTYTLAIVDEGLLDLTAFKTPDPWSFMYSREALGVNTWDIYDYVMGAVGGTFRKMLSVGGDQQINVGAKKDNRFNPVVKVLGPFTLKKGKNHHNVKLPMYVGSVKVMVVAAHEGAYGNAEKAVTVKSPLMAVTSLPRVLGPGESVQAAVNVFALEEGVGNVNVTVKAEGAAKVDGPATKSVSFTGTGDKLLTFAIVGTGEGTANISVTAVASAHKASETIALPVRNPNRPVTKVKYYTVAPNQSINHVLALGDRISGSIFLSGIPSIDYDGVFHFVKSYPYSCSEQLSSRGLTLIHSFEYLSDDKKEDARKLIDEIITQLFARQLPDGSFVYWSGSTMTDLWVTSMAGMFMNEAASIGFEVSSDVLKAWKKYQENAVRNYRHKEGGNRLLDLDQAFRLFTLAISGNEDTGAMNRLKDAANCSVQSKWMLAAAYAACGKKQTAESIIASIEQGFAEGAPGDITFSSNYRDKAVAMIALALAGQTGKAIELAKDISSLFGPGYTSTQECAFAAIGMDVLYASVKPGALKAYISAESGQTDINDESGKFNYVIKPGDNGITIGNQSAGPVYVAISETIIAKAGEKVTPKANGLKLEVSYTTRDGKAVDPTTLKQGTDFEATIKVTNVSALRDYTNVALNAPVASGWEIRNDRLYAAPVAAQNGYDYLDIRDDAAQWFFSLDRGTSKTFKLKLRAAYEGDYILPAITCEMMYDALVSACTASGKAVVTK